MTYLVTDNCIKCKHMDCVKVCPVDCFHEGENMLVIDPDVCIDCGVCEPECPVGAIVPEGVLSPELEIKWYDINSTYASQWPVKTEFEPDEVPEDAAEWDGVADKYENHFSPNPGKGD